MKRLLCLLAAVLCGCASPVKIQFESQKDPPQKMWVATVNLADPRVHLHVAPAGPDPDGAGYWQTTLLPPTEIAARENFDLVINGDFFDARATKDAEGKSSGYRKGIWASVIGPAVSNGKTWSASAKPRPAFVVHNDGSVAIENIGKPSPDDREVIGGNVILVDNGALTTSTNKARHPRTVVGLDATSKKLIILVVDGRKPGVAAGMDYLELAEEMVKLGAKNALNLDGGGSTVLAERSHSTNGYHIYNAPTDGHERPVADVLGVTIDKR